MEFLVEVKLYIRAKMPLSGCFPENIFRKLTGQNLIEAPRFQLYAIIQIILFIMRYGNVS